MKSNWTAWAESCSLRWTIRLLVAAFGIPLICGGAFACLFMVAVAMSIPQIPVWAQRPVTEWMLGIPQPVGRGVDDPGFGEVIDEVDDISAYDTVYTGPTPAGVGVGWQDYLHPEDSNPPQSVPFDHVPLLNCTYHDPDYTSHTGVDFPEPGGTQVYSSMAGLVVWAGYNGPWGNLVVVENNGYQTYYAHLRDIDLAAGQIIASGTPVGSVGTTGVNSEGEPTSSGDHLHYGVKQKTETGYVWLNPQDFFAGDDYIKIACPEE